MSIAFITTFPSVHWDVYAKNMLTSFIKYMPKVPLMVQLDDDLLYDQVNKLLPGDGGIFVGRTQAHQDFVERNKGKDDLTNYRKQAVRFCHKVFAIYKVYDAILKGRKEGIPVPRYVIWVDADTEITRPVSMDEIKACLPKEGDAVSYLGRKDWPHSECGWLAFDLENGGGEVIQAVYDMYVNDLIFQQPEWHDSWIWDLYLKTKGCTNLTEGKPGTEIWEQSPMAAWSKHYKGPAAKQKMVPQQLQAAPPGQNFVIHTKNAIPNEEIYAHVKRNQELIKNWLTECEPNDETLVVCSAGPLLIPEDLRGVKDKIVAVKHALVPLKKAGIKPWACILLDPRPHVADFVKEADKDVLWFVASQVNPKVTEALLEQGCEVWGYHAAVGAGEDKLTDKQADSVVSGGSATATRGLYLLSHLGFRKFHLYGYDLSFPDKPDLSQKDTFGQPKYMEFSVGTKNKFVDVKKFFFSEPQLLAQFEEINEIIKTNKFEIKAFGDGMVPFILRMMELTNLRQRELKCTIGRKITSYERLLCKKKKTNLFKEWPKKFRLTRRKLTVKNR